MKIKIKVSGGKIVDTFISLIFSALLIAFILTLVNFDEIVIDVFKEWFGIKLSLSGYYMLFILANFIFQIIEMILTRGK